MGLLPFSSGKPQPGNGPRLEQKQIYLCVLFPTKKVAVLTPLATNVTIRLNQMNFVGNFIDFKQYLNAYRFSIVS